MKQSAMILGYPDYQQQTKQLAKLLDMPYGLINVHAFPDGESKVQLPPTVPPHIYLFRSFKYPNTKLIELMLTCETARLMGVERITLVAPYLCYLRQDIAFHPGEAVSAIIVGKFISNYVDDLITVDPHLHRINKLSDVFNVKKAINSSAAPLIATYIQQHIKDPLLIGPDEESAQWLEQLSKSYPFETVVGKKIRTGDRNVSVSLPPYEYLNRNIVLVDDMISTGHTISEAAVEAFLSGANSVSCIVTHSLLNHEDYHHLRDIGIKALWSTDSIPHITNKIELAPLLAQVIRDNL